MMARAVVGLGLSLALLASCDDTLSNLGESVQTPRDKVESEQYQLQFEASTEVQPDVYNGFSTDGLLGAYADATYGDFKADFATQLRTAPGFSFSHTPEGGKIDSVRLELLLPRGEGFLGSSRAPMQVSVYELPAGFTGGERSKQELSSYAEPSRLLGEQIVRYASDTVRRVVQKSAVAYAISLKLSNELGQRLYDRSRTSPSDFDTQESFSKKVLGGLYITASAGRGVVLKVQTTNLVVHYHYKEGDSIRQAHEAFINTKLTSRIDGIEHQNLNALLDPQSNYLYSKGPAGVLPAIRLAHTELERLLQNQPKDIQIGKDRSIADTQFKLEIDNPANLSLDPPPYMMLMPKDSLATYFKKGLTERTAAAVSYLSSAYVANAKYYNFSNISRLLTEHLKHHASYNGSKWVVDADLELRVIPVERQVANSGNNVVTTVAIHEYLFPSFVRFKKDATALKIGVTVSKFK